MAGRNVGVLTPRDSVIASEVAYKMLNDAMSHYRAAGGGGRRRRWRRSLENRRNPAEWVWGYRCGIRSRRWRTTANGSRPAACGEDFCQPNRQSRIAGRCLWLISNSSGTGGTDEITGFGGVLVQFGDILGRFVPRMVRGVCRIWLVPSRFCDHILHRQRNSRRGRRLHFGSFQDQKLFGSGALLFTFDLHVLDICRCLARA